MSNNLHDLLKKDTRNFKKKNYPKSSDSSRVVRSTGIEHLLALQNPFIYKAFSQQVPNRFQIIFTFLCKKNNDFFVVFHFPAVDRVIFCRLFDYN